MMKTRKADAGYLRYSSSRQDGNTTIDVQRSAILKAAGGPIREYIDLAKSGRAIARREGLLRLLDDAGEGIIGRVFLYNFARLGRSSETHAVVADLEDLGVEVISCTEGQDALSRGINLCVAQDYSRRLGNTVSRALEQRFSERTWTGGEPPFGLKVIACPDKKKRLAPHEKESLIVRQVFDLYLRESIGVKAIADRLRKAGTPTRRGADWGFTSVRGILHNPVYTGEVRFKRRAYKMNKPTGTRRYKWTDPDNQLVYRDESIRIIDAETFKLVQAKLAQRSRPMPSHAAGRQLRPFTGLIFCGECRSVFYAQKDGRTGRHYYGCSCRARRGKNGCVNAATLREDELLEAIRDLFGLIFEDADTTIERIVKEVTASGATTRHQADDLKSQVTEQDKIIAGLQRLMVDPDVLALPDTRRSILRQCGEAEARREGLRDRLLVLGESAGRTMAALLSEARAVFGDAKRNFSLAASGPELHRFVEDYVGRISVGADGRLARLESQAAPDDAEAALTGIVAATRSDTGRDAITSVFWTAMQARERAA